MTRKCVKSFYKHFEAKNAPALKLHSTNHIEFLDVFEEIFDFKVLVKTFDTFPSHVIGISNVLTDAHCPSQVDS